ncbi:MAG TPA: PAC2 family protein [Microbacteriaceae bacterium]|nr:PAC2 family protein [Microbacteriaceae bacterium]
MAHNELYETVIGASVVPDGLHLVAGLTGFADAGAAVAQFTSQVLQNLESEVVAQFDADELLDYRARRPVAYFDEDHLADFQPLSLTLRLVRDEVGQPFLLLSGFEPDFKWQRFSQAVLAIVERYRVKSLTWLNSIPMPVPHTRPISVTVSGNRHDLIERMSVWRPRTQVPSTVLHLVEYRMQQAGYPVVGFVILVPHYLSDTEYPAAAISAMESVGVSTGLMLPTTGLRDADRDFVANIDEQVRTNGELTRLVKALEERHDKYMQDNPLQPSLTDEDGELPTADEIAAELEDFLAFRRHGDDDGGRTQ